MSGAHDHRMAGSALRLAFALTGVILVVEVVAGFASHSLALLSDAGHILTDVIALGLAWFAVEQSKRPADARRTYGYLRTGILVALVNGVTLIAIAVAIVFEAAQRFAHPVRIDGALVIASASLAIAVNVFITMRLRGQGENLNVRAASLHVVGDLAASVGVVVAAAVVLSTGWLYADPLISVGIAVLVTVSAGRIVMDAANILLEGTPKSIDIAAVEHSIVGVEGVISVHDLHVWSLSSETVALSCHVIMTETSVADAEHAVRAVEEAVCGRFGISHTTIQVEACHPCADDGHATGEHNHPHPVGVSAPGSAADHRH